MSNLQEISAAKGMAQTSQAMLTSATLTLVSSQPKTRLGQVAMAVAAQSSASVLSVAAISAYVYSLTEAQLPTVTFRGPDPGPGIHNPELQQSYDLFRSQVATFQGQAGAWINTDPSSGSASIFSQLVSVPNTFQTISGSVAAKFTILSAQEPGTPAYEQTLAQLKALIGAELPDINTLKTQMETLGSNLQNAAVTIVEAANTGVLKKLSDAYAKEIDGLVQEIKDLNKQISKDNSKIIGLGFAAAAAIALGLVGVANFWNPFGWFAMGAGAVGAYFAISEILTLKGQIAVMKSKIKNDELWQKEDSAVAAGINAFSTQVQGFSSMNTAAQRELTTLENLYQTLADDIGVALADLDAGELEQAQQEWNEIVGAASVLQGLTAYIWPNAIQLTSPTSFSAVDNTAYCVSLSGQLFQYQDADNRWTSLPGSVLSCVASPKMIAAIDGAPIDGASVNPDPKPPTYLVKTYNPDIGRWTFISEFAVAAIAVEGETLICINQAQEDRQVYQYSGSGTDWRKLAALPGPDAATQIAVAAGKVYALANNSQLLYVYLNDSWSLVSETQYASVTSNGNQLGLIDIDQKSYVLDASADGAPRFCADKVSNGAQLSNGSQFIISADDQSLWFVDAQAQPPQATNFNHIATGVFSSNTDKVYYTDNIGQLWMHQGQTLQDNNWIQIASLPAS
ncbi:hypothetical protein [Ferrimonas kyonanensis]|uniref:hypothetical protein n=1 Tax=Ferrimonas kyonanensis TaxID=364763 RepID=UPI0003F57DEB|nr:hypothetical protein [Ferrimonas kyonanensis]